MFVGDFNSKLESFGCAKKNTSGPMLKTIQNKLNLIYLNNDEHTHMDRANGSTDILDMAFVSPNLAIHDIQFQIGDELGSDHLPIEISIDRSPHRNTYTNHTKYKFDQTDREVFESTLEEALGSKKLCVLSLVYNSRTPLSAVFVWGFKFTNRQLDRKTFKVDKWVSLELPTRQ